MTDDWQKFQLAQLGEFRNGANFNRDDFGLGLPIINVKNLFDGRFASTRSLDEIRPSAISDLNGVAVQEGDILFARSSVKASGAGQVAMVKHHKPNTIFSGFIIRFRITSKQEVDPLFLGYLLRSPEYRELLTRIATGTSIINLSQETLKNLEVLLPSLQEQRVITQIVGTLDDKIELNIEMNDTLESLGQALFKSSFLDATQVGLPKGWRMNKLGDLLTCIETGGRPRGGVKHIAEGVPSVGAESIAGVGKFDYRKTKFVSLEFFRSMNKGHVQDLDVLLYKDGGRPGEFEPHLTIVGDGFPFSEFSINEHVYRLRTAPTLPQSFLYFWLSSGAAMDEMRNRGTGVAIPGLNSTQVRELSVLHPPTDVVTKFDKLATPLLRRIFANCNESRTLAKLRDSLLFDLLSGEVRVKANAKVGVELMNA